MNTKDKLMNPAVNAHKAAAVKWKKILESAKFKPITNTHTARTTAVLLENQIKHLNEAANNSSVWGSNAAFGGAVGQGDNYAAGDNRLPKMLIPMIRRTAPELIANEVVGVQAMTGPVGLIFAARYRYENGSLNDGRASDTLTNPAADSAGGYGVGAYRTATDNPPAATDMRQNEWTQGKEMGYNYLDNTYTGRKNSAFNRVINPQTKLPYTDAEVVGVANELANNDATITTKPNWTTLAQVITASTGADAKLKAVALDALNGTSLAGGKFTFSDQDLGVAALTGDYEATGRIPKLKMTFEKQSAEAGTRRLGSSWTLELEQDLRNMNGIDIEDEMSNSLSYELQAEIDREIIVRMMYAALSNGEVSYWDATKANGRWMAEVNRVFYQRVLQVANRMQVRNRRGPANFIIATPDVCTLFETLNDFQLMQTPTTVNTSNGGTAKIGTVGGRFTVYRDTRTPVQNKDFMNQGDEFAYTTGAQAARATGLPDFALLGYKGSEYWDAGIIYCPYIPIMMQKVVDPVSFEPKIGLMTRYGVVDNIFGSHLYYHMILIETLGNILPPANEPANTFPTPWSKNARDNGVRGGIAIEDITPTV